MQKYLFNFCHFSKKALNKDKDVHAEEIVNGPFKCLLEYGKETGILGDAFFDKNSGLYERVLNF